MSTILRAIACACLCAASGRAQSLPAETVRAIEKHYAGARTLKAVFLERYSRGPGDVTLESGTVYFSRPGRMRWEYESPEVKLFLADGNNVWFYVPADRTATRAKTKESSDWHTPLALLAGRVRSGLFARMCQRLEEAKPAPSREGQAAAANAFRCVARKDAPFSDLVVEADSAYRITRLLIREPGGIETEFRFGNWQENLALAEVLFHFQPPQGVAIVEESSLMPRESKRQP